MFENLLTRKQVAEMLGVHTESVKRYEKQGLLEAIKINERVTRYEPKTVAAFIAAGRTKVRVAA